MAQLLTKATVQEVKIANKVAKHLRSTAFQGISGWRIPLSDISLISASDSGGVGSDTGHVQSAQMVLASRQGEVWHGDPVAVAGSSTHPWLERRRPRCRRQPKQSGCRSWSGMLCMPT